MVNDQDLLCLTNPNMLGLDVKRNVQLCYNLQILITKILMSNIYMKFQ